MVEIMNIISSVYQSLISNVPECPPEVGGILGGIDDVISYIKFDEGTKRFQNKQCYYAPDVKKLNYYIEEWEKQGVDFYGMFHTHFYGINSLSDGDKRYIYKIMSSLPMRACKLYFPLVVLPEKKVEIYVAHKQNGRIEICKGKINIIYDKDWPE